jgi:hypothetical protein
VETSLEWVQHNLELAAKDKDITAKEYALTNENSAHQLEHTNKDSAHKPSLLQRIKISPQKNTPSHTKTALSSLELSTKTALTNL